MGYINCDSIPSYCFSSYRSFNKDEKHVTRNCDEDVLLIIIDGALRFHEDGKPIELVGGQYYIQKHGLYQQGCEKCDSPYYFYVHFKADWNFDSGIPYKGEYPKELLSLVKQLDILNNRSASALEKSGVFLQMLSLLKNSRQNDSIPVVANKTASILREGFKQDITVKEIEKKLNYTENYIIRVFKKAFNKTPYEYLTELRLNEAVLRLKYSDLTLNEIAVDCGFKNYINFYKAYVKAYGEKPTDRRTIKR